MVAIIDYDAGNIKSVEKAAAVLGADVIVTSSRFEIERADHVILPGVGAFGEAMDKIRSFELAETIRNVVKGGIPFLGICLGLQVLFESSDESPGAKGLGLLKGRIRKIPIGTETKIPHMGWNSLKFPKKGKLFEGIEQDSYVYFVHSYYLEAQDEEIVTATTQYNTLIHASVEYGNLFACQFHPEKSSQTGLKILHNFLSI